MRARKVLLAGLILFIWIVSSHAESPKFSEPIHSHDNVEWLPSPYESTARVAIKENTEDDAELARLTYTDETEPTVTYSGQKGLNIVIKKDSEIYPYSLVATEPGDYENGVTSFTVYIRVDDTTLMLVVDLVNVNDNKPVISSPEECRVKEEDIFTTDCYFRVTDEDGGACFADMQLDNSQFALTIPPEQMIDNCKEGSFVLKVIVSLDYERYRLHSLKITAKDYGQIGKNKSIDGYQETTVGFVVDVIDIPDVKPVWQEISPSWTIYEKEFWGFTVSAVDGDYGLNWDIEYSLDCGELTADECTLISIDKSTGKLQGFKIDRDERQKEIYKFKIVATEIPEGEYLTSGFEAMSISNDIVLMVNDINDNQPVMEPKTIMMDHKEEQPLSLEKSFIVTDPDLAEHGTFTLLLEGEKQHNFMVIPGTGYQSSEITVTAKNPREMDYEDEDWRVISLTIRAQEVADPDHYDEAHITIKLINEFDSYPEFEQREYPVYIEENEKMGYTVAHTIANDLDEGDIISYSVSNSYMAIDEDGLITTTDDDIFDFERQETIIFQVVAEDLGNLTDFCQVIINVIDLNDEKPSIVIPSEFLAIKEHRDVGTEVTSNIRATDPDTTANLEFEIVWEESSAFKNGVPVDTHRFQNSVELTEEEKEGKQWFTRLVIADNNTFDFEVFDTIKLHIIVTDTETHEEYLENKQNSAILTVTVEDINDNPPVFVPETISQAFIVTENSLEDRIVGTILATDDDGPDHNKITYSIEPFSPKQLVEDAAHPRIVIDNTTGRMYTTKTAVDCDAWKTLEFKYTVIARDEDFFDAEVITIKIEDLNDEIPDLKYPDSPEIINDYTYENTTGIQEIACIKVDDIDYTEDFHTISYILGDSTPDFFSIESHSAPTDRICLMADGSQLDREKQPVQIIEIAIRDNFRDGSKRNSNEGQPVTVQLELLDVNDNNPIFEDSGKQETVYESRIDADQIVFTVKVTDEDIDENGEIHCDSKPEVTALRPDRPQEDIESLFEVKTTGAEECTVIAKKSLRGYWGEYELVLTAHDKGDPSLPGEGTYTLIVISDNLNKPNIIFPTDKEPIRINKDQGTGWNVQLKDIYGNDLRDFHAEDLDDPTTLNGQIEFDLFDEKDIFYTDPITQDTAALRMKKQPGDRQYPVTLKACDRGTPPQCATELEFYIYALDLNSQPEFPQETQTVNFTENTPGLLQSFLITAAVNKDEELMEEDARPIFYFIIEGDTTLFDLDPNTRELKLRRVLDFHTTPEHVLKVLATHDPDPPEVISPSAPVIEIIVEVFDINDKPPSFSQQLFPGTFSVDNEIGKVVVELEAIDPDTGDEVTYAMVLGTLNASDPSLEEFGVNAFVVDPKTGEVKLNFSPSSKILQGFFTFEVVAYDQLGNIDGHRDFANVIVYVVSSAHQVKFYFQNHVDAVQGKKTEVAAAFTEVLVYTCTVEKVLRSESTGGGETSDVVTYFVDDDNRKPVMRDIIEKEFLKPDTYTKLYDSMQELSLSFSGYDTEAPEESRGYLTIVLAAVCAVLAVLVVVFSLAFVVRTRTLNQRLEKLTDKKFGSQDSGLNRIGMGVPGTNIHALEGSNPVWNNDIEHNFDNMSQSSVDSDLVGIEDSPEFREGGVDNVSFEAPGESFNPYAAAGPELTASAPLDLGPRRASINPLAAGAGPIDLEEVGLPRRISLNPLAAGLDEDFSSADAEEVASSAINNFSFQRPHEPSTEL